MLGLKMQCALTGSSCAKDNTSVGEIQNILTLIFFFEILNERIAYL